MGSRRTIVRTGGSCVPGDQIVRPKFVNGHNCGVDVLVGECLHSVWAWPEPSTVPIECRRPPPQERHQQPTSKRLARASPINLTLKDREQVVGGHPRRSPSSPQAHKESFSIQLERLCWFRTKDLLTQLLSGEWRSSITVRQGPKRSQVAWCHVRTFERLSSC